MANEPCFAYEEKGFFAPAPANLITGKECDIKYLTGLLNSSFVYFLMRKFYMRGGIEGELKTNNLLKLPIPQITKSNQKSVDRIIALVDEILAIKAFCHSERSEESLQNDRDVSLSMKAQHDKIPDTAKLESEIDTLVYELYNLTGTEIETIESK